MRLLKLSGLPAIAMSQSIQSAASTDKHAWRGRAPPQATSAFCIRRPRIRAFTAHGMHETFAAAARAQRSVSVEEARRKRASALATGQHGRVDDQLLRCRLAHTRSAGARPPPNRETPRGASSGHGRARRLVRGAQPARDDVCRCEDNRCERARGREITFHFTSTTAAAYAMSQTAAAPAADGLARRQGAVRRLGGRRLRGGRAPSRRRRKSAPAVCRRGGPRGYPGQRRKCQSINLYAGQRRGVTERERTCVWPHRNRAGPGVC